MKRFRYKLSVMLLFIAAIVYIPITVAVLNIVEYYEREEAMENAEAAADRMIERNLAVHRYFAKNLKPSVIELTQGGIPEGYFDPNWMSSTYAIRIMQGYLTKSNELGYYYKECAVNARSPENEADPFEREFLERSAKDPGFTQWSGIRDMDGKPFFVVLKRGESMEEGCLLCHSDPSTAPRGLVDRFGDKRSFGRRDGDLVSAMSVRIPLETMYHQATHQSNRLVLSISVVLASTMVLLFFLGRAYVYRPLTRLRDAVRNAERDESRLGLPIETGGSREIQEVADAFAGMSARVRNHLDDLGTEVSKRTGHLEEANRKLVNEIVERAKAQAELSDSETRYRSLFANMSEAFALHEVILDDEGKVTDYRFLDVNPAFEKETGLSRGKVVGATQMTLMPDEDPFWKETYAKIALGGEPVHVSHYSPVLKKHYDVYAFSPEPFKFAVLFRDVTEKMLTEEKVRASEEKYRLLAENASDVIWLMDPVEGKFLYVSPSVQRLRGFTPEEVMAQPPSSALSPDSLEVVRRLLEERMPSFIAGEAEGMLYTDTVYQPRKDGAVVPTEVTTRFIRDAKSGSPLIVGVSRDISERRRAEAERDQLQEKLAQAQKMEAIGTLAGGIAHDFNNILGAILGYTELSMAELPEHSEVRDNLQEVFVASTRAKELVNQILAVSRRGEKKLVPVEVHRVVLEAMKLLSSVIPKTIAIEQKVDFRSGLVLADPTELHQVVMNLCTNAYQAMSPKGGRLRIELKAASVGPQEASRVHGLAEGEYIKLVVEDTGEGMDKETLSKVFEPYFTTKVKGTTKGTGLGLAVVQSIVTGIKGAIEVRSAPGEGTAFVVYLPRYEPQKDAASEPSSTAVAGGSGAVLFVDDEQVLARLGMKMLESLGYLVFTSTDPCEALRLFEENPAGFDLLVTDQTMPGLTGVELIAKARELKPGLPAVICTGYSDLIDEEGAQRLGIAAFVRKPYDRKRLGEAVAMALAGGVVMC